MARLHGLYPGSSVAATLLGAAMFATASSFYLLRWYAPRHAKLFKMEFVDHAHIAIRGSIFAPILYFFSMIVAQNYAPLATAIQIIVP